MGTQYAMDEKWMFTGGVSYDTAMMSESQRTASLPSEDNWRFGIGTQYT